MVLSTVKLLASHPILTACMLLSCINGQIDNIDKNNEKTVDLFDVHHINSITLSQGHNNCEFITF